MLLTTCGAAGGEKGPDTQAFCVHIAAANAPVEQIGELPPLTGRVADQANLLSPAAEDRLTRLSQSLEQRTGDQMVVVTVPSLRGHPIERVGRALGNGWGIGQRGKDNGVILLVAPSEKQVRIEVGYGLDAFLTDARAREIVDADLLPGFRDGDPERAITRGSEAIARALLARPDAPRVGACRRGRCALS
jgi:uncharacterized protein